MNWYRLQINCASNVYDKLTKILNVEPLNPHKNSFWIYELEEKDNQNIDFINIFLNILEPNFSKLEEINIKKEDITIWRIYKYESQCAMEFSPQEMKRLGDSGITFCIDCFQKNTY